MTTKPLPDLDPSKGYLMSLTLENIRCFGSPAEILYLTKLGDPSKPARWTVILGANGVGKTTVLRALAMSCSVIYEFQDPVYLRQFSRTEFTFGGICFSNSVGLQIQQEVGFETGVSMEVLDNPRNENGDAADQLPFIAGYGAGRGTGNSFKSRGHVETLFNKEATTRDPSRIWSRLQYKAAIEGENLGQAVGHLREALIKILPIAFDVTMTFDTEEEPRLQFRTNDGWITLEDMSWGYQVFAAFAIDYASRLIQWYPDSKTPLAEPGICLVDELDLHMHPSWQRKVIDDLSHIFPATQFIVTVHSPLVVQAAEDANLVVLRRYPDDPSRVMIDNDVEAIKGWRIDQVLTSDLFGLDSSRPPSVAKAMDERAELLAKNAPTPQEQERLDALEAQAMELPNTKANWEEQARALVLAAAEQLKRGA